MMLVSFSDDFRNFSFLAYKTSVLSINYKNKFMLEYYFFVSLFMFFILTGIFIFSSFQKHLLITLLSLEYIILNVFLLLSVRQRWDVVNSFIILVFLIFTVSEGRLGLSILISLTRSHGSDIIKRLRVLW